MIVKSDYSGNHASIFECDRCKVHMDMSKEKRYNVIIDSSIIGSSYIKHLRTYHLCKKCASLLCNGIEKGNKKHDKTG